MNWKTWLKGLGAASVGGAATVISAVSVAPELPWAVILKIAGANAAVSAAAYLKQSPLPSDTPPAPQDPPKS